MVHKKDIIAMLRQKGINVYRGARLQVKMQGTDGEAPIPMGTGMMTDRVNLVVSPMHVAFAACAWPPTLWVRNEKTGMDFEFTYRLGGKSARNACIVASTDAKGPLTSAKQIAPSLDTPFQGSRARAAWKEGCEA